MNKKEKLCILGIFIIGMFLVLYHNRYITEGVTNINKIFQKWDLTGGGIKYTVHKECASEPGKVFGKDNMGVGADILGKDCYNDNGLVNNWDYFMKPQINDVQSTSHCKKACQERIGCKGFTYDTDKKQCFLFNNYPLTVSPTTRHTIRQTDNDRLRGNTLLKPVPKDLKIMNERCSGDMVNQGSSWIAIYKNYRNPPNCSGNNKALCVGTYNAGITNNLPGCIKGCKDNPKCKAYSYIKEQIGSRFRNRCIMFGNYPKERPSDLPVNVKISTPFPPFIDYLRKIGKVKIQGKDRNIRIINGCDSEKMKGGKYINGTKLFCGQWMKQDLIDEEGNPATKNMSNWGVYPNNLFKMYAGKKGRTSVKKKLKTCQKQCNEDKNCQRYTWIPYSRTAKKTGSGDCFLFSKATDNSNYKIHDLTSGSGLKYGYSSTSQQCLSQQSGTKYANKYDCWNKEVDPKGAYYRGTANRWAIKDPTSGDIIKEGTCLAWAGEPNKRVGCGAKGKACSANKLVAHNADYPLGSPPKKMLTYLPKNYCRNYTGVDQQPWCYTSDPTVRWAYCQTSDKKKKIVGGMETCKSIRDEIVKKTYDESIILLEKKFKDYPCYPHCDREKVDRKDIAKMMKKQMDILNVMKLDISYNSAFILINNIGEETTKGVYLIDINTWDNGKDGNVFKPIRWKNMRNGNIIEAQIERYNTGVLSKVIKWVLKSKGKIIAETETLNGEWKIIGADNILSGAELTIKFPNWNKDSWTSSTNQHLETIEKNMVKQLSCNDQMKIKGLWENDIIGGENWESNCSYPKTPNTIGTDRMTLSTIDTLTMEKELVRLLELCASKDGTMDDCERARIVSKLK